MLVENNPKVPKDITEDEIVVADRILEILNEKSSYIRIAKFYNHYYRNQPIAEYDRYKKEIDKAVEIYDTQGEEELIEYLKTQEWGVRHERYDPKEIILREIEQYGTGVHTLTKSHIRISRAVEFHPQERNIFQKFEMYLRQLDLLVDIGPLLRTFIRMWEDNAEKFTSAERKDIGDNISLFLQDTKHYKAADKDFLVKMMHRIDSQISKAQSHTNSAELLLF